MTAEDNKRSAQELYQQARDLAGREHGYTGAAFSQGSTTFVCKADGFTGTMLECGEHALEAMERAGQAALSREAWQDAGPAFKKWLEQHQDPS